jgi:hypothetical protein
LGPPQSFSASCYPLTDDDACSEGLSPRVIGESETDSDTPRPNCSSAYCGPPPAADATPASAHGSESSDDASFDESGPSPTREASSCDLDDRDSVDCDAPVPAQGTPPAITLAVTPSGSPRRSCDGTFSPILFSPRGVCSLSLASLIGGSGGGARRGEGANRCFPGSCRDDGSGAVVPRGGGGDASRDSLWLSSLPTTTLTASLDASCVLLTADLVSPELVADPLTAPSVCVSTLTLTAALQSDVPSACVGILAVTSDAPSASVPLALVVCGGRAVTAASCESTDVVLFVILYPLQSSNAPLSVLLPMPPLPLLLEVPRLAWRRPLLSICDAGGLTGPAAETIGDTCSGLVIYEGRAAIPPFAASRESTDVVQLDTACALTVTTDLRSSISVFEGSRAIVRANCTPTDRSVGQAAVSGRLHKSQSSKDGRVAGVLDDTAGGGAVAPPRRRLDCLSIQPYTGDRVRLSRHQSRRCRPRRRKRTGRAARGARNGSLHKDAAAVRAASAPLPAPPAIPPEPHGQIAGGGPHSTRRDALRSPGYERGHQVPRDVGCRLQQTAPPPASLLRPDETAATGEGGLTEGSASDDSTASLRSGRGVVPTTRHPDSRCSGLPWTSPTSTSPPDPICCTEREGCR